MDEETRGEMNYLRERIDSFANDLSHVTANLASLKTSSENLCKEVKSLKCQMEHIRNWLILLFLTIIGSIFGTVIYLF